MKQEMIKSSIREIASLATDLNIKRVELSVEFKEYRKYQEEVEELFRGAYSSVAIINTAPVSVFDDVQFSVTMYGIVITFKCLPIKTI